MPSANADNTAPGDVSRLTDDQARAIVTSGMAEEPAWLARTRREDELWQRQRRIENAARTEWLKTPDVIKARSNLRITYIALIVALVATACGTFTLIVFAGMSWRTWSPVLFTGLIIAISLGALSWNVGANLRYSFVAYRDSYEEAQKRQGSTKRGKVPERWLSDPDLQNLLLVNRTQLNVYQDIATKDAKAASRNSRFAIAIGFLILVVGAVVAIRTPNSTSKIIVGALASLGSVLSGYIGQTFLKAQAQAMKQLNFYFRQPLIASYLLSAERIAFKLGDGNSTKQALLDVIKNVLLAANRAEGPDSASSDAPRSNTSRQGLRRVSNIAQTAANGAKPGN